MLEIRQARESDLPAINAIYNYHVLHGTGTFDTEPVAIETRRDWFDAHGERYPILVAGSEGEVTGWASLSPYHARPAYRFTAEDSVYVSEEHRGRGVGAGLLRSLLVDASRLGYHTVIALIGDSQNTASIALHRRLGFQHAGVQREVGYKFDRWLDVVVMQWTAPGPHT